MATTGAVFANANTVVTTGWTNATNAYADDGSYATAAPGKNLTVSSDYGFPAFDYTIIPANAVVDSVVAEVQFKVSTTTSIATMGIQLRDNGTLLGSQQTDATEPTVDTLLTHTIATGLTLQNFAIANQMQVRVSAIQGNSSTAVTFSVDYCTLNVTYHLNPLFKRSRNFHPGGKCYVSKQSNPTVVVVAPTLKSGRYYYDLLKPNRF